VQVVTLKGSRSISSVQVNGSQSNGRFRGPIADPGTASSATSNMRFRLALDMLAAARREPAAARRTAG
jgi:hypothetical protein